MKRDTAGKPLLIVGTLRNLEQYEGVDQVTGLLRHSSGRDRFERTLEGRAGFHEELLLLGIDGLKTSIYSTATALVTLCFGQQRREI